MAQTEITVQIFEDLEKIENKLKELGYTITDTFTGSDEYFSTLDSKKIKNASYKELLDSSILIRKFHKTSTDSIQAMLIHKKKTLDNQGRVIGEEKSKIEIDNGEQAHKLLTNAGLINWMSLNQKNSFYKLGEITIIVGKTEGLDGCFMEIEEYDSIKNKPEEEKFCILSDFVNSLGFKKGEDYSCKKIYILYQNSQNLNKSKKRNKIE